MLSKKILGLTSTLLLLSISQSVLADHGPQKLFKRKMQPYFSAHETKQMGPFKIDIHSYGQEITHTLPHVDTQKYRHIFHDRFNLAALLRERMKSYLNVSIKDMASMRILCFMECQCPRLL